MSLRSPKKLRLQDKQVQRSVILVGLMGAGKTSVGRRLADMLGAPFFDSDNEIETASAMSIPEIFDKYGEPEFRRLEREVIKRLVAGENAVIATGGGAFMDARTRAVSAARAVSVWLDVELETLWSRVAQRSGRPLLDVDDPKRVLADLLAERAPVYARADITVSAGAGLNQEDVASNVVAALTEFGRTHPDRAVITSPEVTWSAKA